MLLFFPTFLAIKQIVYYVKNKTTVFNYWHFITATRFGLSLDHVQSNFHEEKYNQSGRVMNYGI